MSDSGTPQYTHPQKVGYKCYNPYETSNSSELFSWLDQIENQIDVLIWISDLFAYYKTDSMRQMIRNTTTGERNARS